MKNNSSNDTHRNHITPRFYLKFWRESFGDGSKFACYDPIHTKYSFRTEDSTGYIDRTYPVELETLLGKWENRISDDYSAIIDKLSNSSFDAVLGRKLSSQEERILLEFFYVQSIRTVSGRIGLINNANNTVFTAETLMKAAESQNDNLFKNVEYVYGGNVRAYYDDCYKFIIKSDLYDFWTSTNPIHYAEMNRLLDSAYKYDGLEDKADIGMLALSPKLLLCMFPHGKWKWCKIGNHIHCISISGLPDAHYELFGSAEDIVRSVNFSLLQGFEPQISFNGDYHDVDLRACYYYLISRNFSDKDKVCLSSYHIEPLVK